MRARLSHATFPGDAYGCAEALRDEDYVIVEAPLTLARILGESREQSGYSPSPWQKCQKPPLNHGAGNETRTRGLNLGKIVAWIIYLIVFIIYFQFFKALDSAQNVQRPPRVALSH